MKCGGFLYLCTVQILLNRFILLLTNHDVNCGWFFLLYLQYSDIVTVLGLAKRLRCETWPFFSFYQEMAFLSHFRGFSRFVGITYHFRKESALNQVFQEIKVFSVGIMRKSQKIIVEVLEIRK